MLVITEPVLGFMFLILLLVASITDLVARRIPNVVTLGGALAGLSLNTWAGGGDGLLSSVAGIATGFAIFLPMYLGRGMAAGDVKLMASVGAFLGPKVVLIAAALTLIVGGALAVFVVVARGGMRLTISRFGRIGRTVLRTKKWVYERPQAGDAAAHRFPYALAIAAGTLLAVGWPGV